MKEQDAMYYYSRVLRALLRNTVKIWTLIGHTAETMLQTTGMNANINVYNMQLVPHSQYSTSHFFCTYLPSFLPTYLVICHHKLLEWIGTKVRNKRRIVKCILCLTYGTQVTRESNIRCLTIVAAVNFNKEWLQSCCACLYYSWWRTQRDVQ